MTLDSHLDLNMTLTWNWKFNIRNGFCIPEYPQQLDLYIILR